MHDTGDSHTTFTYTSIGAIHTPFYDIAGMPIQPAGARGTKGTVEIFPWYREGLRDLDGFERVILIYALHKCTDHLLTVIPFLDKSPRGVFATRSPKRPNAIGLSVVRLISVEEGTLNLEDVDMLDGTPLLDIKPYVPEFDACPDSRCGWFENVARHAGTVRSDDRFR